MIRELYLIAIILFFLFAFAVRNIRTYLSVKQPIRGNSLKLTLSILLSTAIYVLLLLRLTVMGPDMIFEVDFSMAYVMKFLGMFLVTTGFVLGILALMEMRDSWRVGIRYQQKTTLITSGVFSVSRNPYFLSYHLLITGFILIFPSMILLVLYLALAIVFHKMILEEERYLESVHGASYLSYRKKVSRYLIF